jgi:hypothetical protein
VHRSVQCSNPVREGVIRWTLVVPWHRPQRDVRTRGVVEEEAV